MAKPIRATPTLKGEEAIRFIAAVRKEERQPSKARVDMIRSASRTRFNVA
jgi:hypothetical protein